MKAFAIRDEYLDHKLGYAKDLAVLLYYERAQKFFIEIPEDLTILEAPLILSSFVKRRNFSVDEKWSLTWVQQRIVPPERQNIGQILRENHLKYYDEFRMLMLADGRCEQDDCYLVPLKPEELPKWLTDRYQNRVKAAMPLSDHQVLVFFQNGPARKFDANAMYRRLCKYYARFDSEELFRGVKVDTGGRGLSWGSEVKVPADEVVQKGEPLPITLDDFKVMVGECLLNTAEAAQLLDCSRQNINDLVKKGKLKPLKKSEKNMLFLKDEVLAWQRQTV